MNGKKVKWLLIGAGDIVKSRVAAALTQAENSEIAAIFAPSVGKAETIAEQYHIPRVFHDSRQAFAESGADCAYIAASHHVHVELAKQALEAGYHFLCEKPLGINSAECLDLLACAEKHPGLKTSCSNYRLMTKQFLTTKQLIDKGEIGDLVCGWAHDEEPYYNPSGAPLLKAKGRSPVLVLGFYLINMAQILFGNPESVFAQSASFNTKKLDPFDIDDLTTILLRFPGGRQFTILLNQASQAPLRHSYEFCGSAGRILWPECPPHFNSPVWKIQNSGSTSIPESVTPNPGSSRLPNWHLPMVQDFVNCVLNGGDPLCSLKSAVQTSVISEAVFRSAATGMPEKIPSLSF